MTNSEPTCQDRIDDSWQSTRRDLNCMYGGTASEIELREFFKDEGQDAQELRKMNRDELDQQAADVRGEYGLGFDYVASNTFNDQPDGYWRYQFSWGWPSTELRFYADTQTLNKAEYWFLDWFDGASITVTTDEVVQAVWQDFYNTGATDYAYQESLPPVPHRHLHAKEHEHDEVQPLGRSGRH